MPFSYALSLLLSFNALFISTLLTYSPSAHTYREIKLGSHDFPTLEKVIRCVEFATHNMAGSAKGDRAMGGMGV
jgi:hypothetical protein